MKKILALILCALFMFTLLCACGNAGGQETNSPDPSDVVTNSPEPSPEPEPADGFVYGDGAAELYDLDGHVICVGSTSGVEVYILHLGGENWEVRYFRPDAGPLSSFFVDGEIVEILSPNVGSFMGFLEEMGVIGEMTADFGGQIENLKTYIQDTYGMDVTALGASGQLPPYTGEATIPEMPGGEEPPAEDTPAVGTLTVNDDGTVTYITHISSPMGEFDVECSGVVADGVVTIQSVYNMALSMDVTGYNDLDALSAEAQAAYDALNGAAAGTLTVNDDGTVTYNTHISSPMGEFDVECSGVLVDGVITIQSVYNLALSMDVTGYNDLDALSAEAQAIYDAR